MIYSDEERKAYNDELARRTRAHEKALLAELKAQGADLDDPKSFRQISGIYTDVSIKEYGGGSSFYRRRSGKLCCVVKGGYHRHALKAVTFRERKDQSLDYAKVAKAILDRVANNKSYEDAYEAKEIKRLAAAKKAERLKKLDNFEYPNGVTCENGLGVRFVDLTEAQARALLKAAAEIGVPQKES